MTPSIDLSQHEIFVGDYLRNAAPAQLYEEALRQGHARITSSGALACRSGERTGRSPKDKRIVDESLVTEDVWWGDVNVKLDPVSYSQIRQQAISFLNTLPRLYIMDGYAGWDERYRQKIRVICESAYHALFMHNMLMRPSEQELEDFGEPDFVIFNAGRMSANPFVAGLDSGTSITLSFENRELVILGTQYAGEMKKGVFTVMNYLMPKQGVLSMHCSANEGVGGDVTLFFGLSGTGKTTFSADPHRRLIGDDEHCWTDHGIFNIEAGCYAKAIDLSETSEPAIFRAIQFGTVLENVVFDAQRHVDYTDTSVTKNTRASYPIESVDRAKIPCVGGHPRNLILLTCDAFGVLPPVSQLSNDQAIYHFISGYTAKVAATEVGVTEPQATFSACFGEAFLVWHPAKYAEMLAAKMHEHGSKAWLVNTGWTGGTTDAAERIPLHFTRTIIDAIHDGSLEKQEMVQDPIFGLRVPTACGEVPKDLLIPEHAWSDSQAYRSAAEKLVGLFHENFAKYAEGASQAIRDAGPILSPNVTRKRKRRRRVAG